MTGGGLSMAPPVGRVGSGAEEARKRGSPYLVGTRSMERGGRAVEKGETQGFVKIVIDAGSKAILGAAILGTDGDEAIHGIIDMMSMGATATQLQRTVPIHPTVSELIPTLVSEAKAPRSEEHTSELQSLMRISYAVFCLTQKKTNNTNTHTM